MEIFKQSMAFVLVLVAVWLASTASSRDYPFRLAALAVVLAFSAWMWRAWVRLPGRKRWAARTAALVLAVAAAAVLLRHAAPPAVTLVPFDQARIDRASQAGQIVLVDFTASWCLTCKQVEATVYDNPHVAALLKQLNVLAVKGDVTTADLPANALKDKLGEPIPVTAIFPPGQSPLAGASRARPILLRGLFSSKDLADALQKAQSTPPGG